MRINLGTVRQSRLPKTIGLCAGDSPEISAAVNAAQLRLIQEGGETGFAGGWQRVAFTINLADPYLTLPSSFARAINLDVCRTPVQMHNEFWEFLPGGPGLKGTANVPDWCGNLQGYERGTFPTMVDVTSTNQFLRAYATDPRDYGKSLLITALDNNNLPIYGTLNGMTVNGVPIIFAGSFTDSTAVSSIVAVQKDVTYGDVILKQVDFTTGVEVTLARYAPWETVPLYRRYYISHLPSGCCPQGNLGTVAVTALCKLEYVPVSRDTDLLVIGNIEALIEECHSIRLSGMENTEALQLASAHHAKATKILQNEMRHYQGEQTLSVSVQIFPRPLRCAGIGSLT